MLVAGSMHRLELTSRRTLRSDASFRLNLRGKGDIASRSHDNWDSGLRLHGDLGFICTLD